MANFVTDASTANLLQIVTLADEGNDSILTDIAKRAFHGNVAMKVTQHGGHL